LRVLRFGLATEKAVVAGDFRQLPPIVMSREDICEKWLKRDVFYSAGIVESVARRQYPATLVALENQYRMAQALSALYHPGPTRNDGWTEYWPGKKGWDSKQDA
jgi:hypothetical protein